MIDYLREKIIGKDFRFKNKPLLLDDRAQHRTELSQKAQETFHKYRLLPRDSMNKEQNKSYIRRDTKKLKTLTFNS